MSGKVNLASDYSLVRVVLIDTYGNHYMVFESYPLITKSNAFDTIDTSDETTFLEGVICDSLRIDLINANLDLDSLNLDTNFISNAAELQAQAKWDHDSVKIVIMNQRIEEENMYWRAGRNNYVELTFQERESLFGSKFNPLGFDFYIGGIFEFYTNRVHIPASSSIVSTFDWRDRHGANDPASPYFDKDYSGNETGWLTSIKPQLSCNTCYIFSPVGAAEAVANLFYNFHDADPTNPKPHLDLDLSELQILKCCLPNVPCTDPGTQPPILTYMELNDIHNETCLEYTPDNIQNKTCGDVCTDFTYNFRILGHGEVDILQNQQQANEIALKEAIITKGPMGSGLLHYSSANISHYMTILGFGTVGLGDIVYHGSGPFDPDIVIDEECPLIRSTFWYFKNSYLDNPYVHYSGELYGELHATYYIDGVFLEYTEPDSDPEIVCTDEDEDGYYWWGISQTTPCPTCPPGINQQEDCDDNNPNVGPYNADPGNDYPLYKCLPNCTYDPHPLYITENTFWNEPMHFNRNISIIHGNTLTINSQITFGPNVKIFVNPGATLIINAPAVLTTSGYCNTLQGYLWEGIYVLGDPFRTQTDPSYQQGKVIINGTSANNTALIENAKCAVNMLNPEFNPDGSTSPYPVGAPSGGILFAEYATFKDCKLGVRFHPYRYDNISYFRNCSFTTENELASGAYPDCFVRMDGVSGIEIKKCIFQNTRPQNENSFGNRGKGLYCFNSSITLPESGDPNLFSSLDYGIYAMNGAAAPIINVNNCNFQDNKHGCYFNGFQSIGNTTIEDNQYFHIGANRPWGTSYMLYLHDCSGYQVRNNSFEVGDNVYDPSAIYIGIIVHNSGSDNNWIYRNTFTNLTVSIQSQNQNREDATPALTGLRLLCNNYTNDKTNANSDVKVTYDPETTNWINGIAFEQKNISYPLWYDEQEPAGNTFTYLPDPNNHYDIDINAHGPVNSIEYYHHPNVPGFKLKPTYFSNPLKVTTFELNLNYLPTGTSCPEGYIPPLGEEGLKEEVDQADNKIDSLQNLLLALIDEGSTDTLNTVVNTSFPNQSWEVYQDLMNASPYLSDTVLKTSIYKEEVLPDVMIRDIMVANPHSAKDDNILTALDNRQNPMADSLWYDILEGRDSVSAKEILESELSSWQQKRDLYFNKLIELYRSDTLHLWAVDSLIAFLGDNNTLKAKYSLILWYVEQRQFPEADNVLQEIPSNYDLSTQEAIEHQKFTLLLPVLEQLSIDSVGFLCPDSTQKATLFQIISDYDDLPGNFSRNILINNGLLTYQEPIVTDPTLKSTKRFHNLRKTPVDKSFIKVFPNPCRDYIIVEYLNKPENFGGVFELYDITGKKLLTKTLYQGYDQLLISMLDLEKGMYYLYVKDTNGRKTVRKIIKSY